MKKKKQEFNELIEFGKIIQRTISEVQRLKHEAMMRNFNSYPKGGIVSPGAICEVRDGSGRALGRRQLNPNFAISESLGQSWIDEAEWLRGLKDGIWKTQNQQQMEKQFKEGDEVWDRTLYPGMEGKVSTSNTTQKTGNVLVKFGPCEIMRVYYKNGSTTKSGIQTLFHHDYEIELKPVEVKFEKDELVLVRDDIEEGWTAARFAENPNKCKLKMLTFDWKYVIKFDPEKALKVTKD